jgi:hypothetical protein
MMSDETRANNLSGARSPIERPSARHIRNPFVRWPTFGSTTTASKKQAAIVEEKVEELVQAKGQAR